MIEKIPLLDERLRYSTERIEELKMAVQNNEDLKENDVCVYLTGSYGRREAHSSSDLDLFFLRSGSAETCKLPRVEKALFDAALIKAARKLEFPEFTKGGAYLDIHYLDDILKYLGCPEDDYRNYFTARMLLLLESTPILNEKIYEKIISSIVESYYRDYHDHEINFRPAFLLNDIHRYWITMCLNYEHARNRRDREDGEKNEAHLKNLKLKFSRLMTCYSMIVPILAFPDVIPPEEIIKLAHKTPISRLLDVASEHERYVDTVKDVLLHYTWFLEITGQSKPDVLEWISLETNRNEAFDRSREFGKSMFKLVTEAVSDQEKLRYLIV